MEFHSKMFIGVQLICNFSLVSDLHKVNQISTYRYRYKSNPIWVNTEYRIESSLCNIAGSYYLF